MKTALLIVGTTLLASLAAAAHAEPVYKTTKATIACDDADGDKILFEALHSPKLPPTCRKLPANFEFEAMNRSSFYTPPGATQGIGVIYGRDLRTTGDADDHYFNVLTADVAPVLDAAGQFTQAPCAGMGDGEIRRMETDKDGRLYLKRYMLVTKCVGGKVQSTLRPLD